jgi:uncharacterized membrane protein
MMLDSKYIGLLSYEIGAVAIITAVALMLAVHLGGSINTVRKAGLVGLLIGACIHLAFELFGGNSYYCSSGAACMKRS